MKTTTTMTMMITNTMNQKSKHSFQCLVHCYSTVSLNQWEKHCFAKPKKVKGKTANRQTTNCHLKTVTQCFRTASFKSLLFDLIDSSNSSPSQLACNKHIPDCITVPASITFEPKEEIKSNLSMTNFQLIKYLNWFTIK